MQNLSKLSPAFADVLKVISRVPGGRGSQNGATKATVAKNTDCPEFQ